MNKECQNPECNNIGRKVKAIIEINGKDETHEIYMCRACISFVSSVNGGFKN